MVQQMRERRDLLMKNAVEVTTGVSIFKLQWVKKQTKPLRDATPLARAQISNSEEKRTDQHRETHQQQQHRNLESLPGRCGLYRWNGMRRTWTETHVQRRFLAATQAHALSCTPGRWRHGWISGSGWQLEGARRNASMLRSTALGLEPRTEHEMDAQRSNRCRVSTVS